jgi:hypothetical protein
MRVIAPAVLILLTSCAGGYMPAYEAQGYPDIDEKKLSLSSATSKEEFLGLLREKSATNLIMSEGYLSGKVVSAVTADFMDYIYLFSDGKFVGRVPVKYDEGRPPVHPFVKVVHGRNLFGLVLLADNMQVGAKRVAQLILIEKGGKITYKNVALDDLIEKHDGLYDPYIGGENLSTGLVLCARNRKGKAWNLVYLITLKGDSLEVKPEHQDAAFGCSCFADWLAGMDGREVFKMNPP